MLLELLDTPWEAPQTMAFAVDRDRLERYRDALRAARVAGDAEPMKALWSEHAAAFRTARANARLRVDAARLRDACAAAKAQPEAEPLRAELEALELELATVEALELSPRDWIPIAGGALSMARLDALRHEAPIIAESRVEALVGALRDAVVGRASAATDEELDDTGVPGGDLGSWLHTARERSARVDALFEVRAQLQPLRVLEALVGPFAASRGPGPFLDVPGLAPPLEPWSDECAPLFSPSLWADSFETGAIVPGGHHLEGGLLGRAAGEVRTADPDRGWHRDYVFRAFADDALWMRAIAEHWPRCRRRFLELLEEAARADRAVVLLPGTYGHPTWIGAEAHDLLARG